jgi:hypothetical protein
MSLSIIDTFKIFINTLVRIVPIGLYAGSAMSGSVFQDFRGLLLFCGFLVNELLGLGYRMVLHGVANPQCALLYSEGGTPFVLPSPITQTVGFFAGFFFMDMYFTSGFSAAQFIILMILILITIFSRMNVGCKTLLDAIYCTLIGLLFGVVYYNLVQPYYKADYLKDKIETANTDINAFFTMN